MITSQSRIKVGSIVRIRGIRSPFIGVVTKAVPCECGTRILTICNKRRRFESHEVEAVQLASLAEILEGSDDELHA